jgi:DNA modification methylase
MMPSPYYDQDGITIYCGDCREILPHLPKVDLVLTDPPYGINHRRGKCSNRGKGVSNGCLPIVGDDIPFNPEPFIPWPASTPEAILWGANWYADKLPAGRWLIWDKQEHGGSGDFSEAEIAWCSKPGAIKVFRHMWLGVQRASEIGESRLHPTQKPVELMRWCLGFAPDAQTILDPFMGSGTTLRAAKDLRRRAIGIEINEDYCKIAVERLRQQVFSFV